MTRWPDSGDKSYDYAAALRRIIDLIVDTLDNYANAGVTIDWPSIHDLYVRLTARARLLAASYPQIAAPLDDLVDLIPTLYDTANWQDIWDSAFSSGEWLYQKAYAVKAASLTLVSTRSLLGTSLCPADERLIAMAIDVNARYRDAKGAKLAEIYRVEVPSRRRAFYAAGTRPSERLDVNALGQLDAIRCAVLSHALARMFALLTIHIEGGRLTRGSAAHVIYARLRSLADANIAPAPALAERVHLLTDALPELDSDDEAKFDWDRVTQWYADIHASLRDVAHSVIDAYGGSAIPDEFGRVWQDARALFVEADELIEQLRREFEQDLEGLLRPPPGGTPPIERRTTSGPEERPAMDEPEGLGRQPADHLRAAAGFSHSDDYRSVRMRDEPFFLTRLQAAAVQVLDDALSAGTPELRWQEIQERLRPFGLHPPRMREVVRRLGDWRKLIAQPKPGVYRLLV